MVTLVKISKNGYLLEIKKVSDKYRGILYSREKDKKNII